MSRLKDLRTEKGLTLSKAVTELNALGLKLTPTSLARYEKWPNKGGRNPSFETWATLADYFGVSVNELIGTDDINKRVSNVLSEFKKSNDKMLSDQLDRISSSELHKFESSTLATAIKTVMDLYERYDFNDETIEASVMLSSFNRMIKNEVDDDDDYQDTIDIFTKLVNNLKEQNKKASE